MVFVWFLDVVGRYLVLLTPLSHHPLVELQSEVANQPEPHTGKTISMLVLVRLCFKCLPGKPTWQWIIHEKPNF